MIISIIFLIFEALIKIIPKEIMAKESCCHAHSHSSVSQTISEMDFERGIWTAALNGDLERLQKLLDDGTDVNQPDMYGYTALHYAARNGHLQAVKLLLKCKSDPNRKTRSGEATPLQRAAYQGHLDIVALLVQHGAEVDTRDSDGKTALHKAAERNHVVVCNFLTTKWPQLKLQMDHKGQTAYDVATDETCRGLLN